MCDLERFSKTSHIYYAYTCEVYSPMTGSKLGLCTSLVKPIITQNNLAKILKLKCSITS